MAKVSTLSFPRNDVCQRDGGGVLGAPLSMPPGRGVLGGNSTCTWLCCRLVYTVDGVFIGYWYSTTHEACVALGVLQWMNV